MNQCVSEAVAFGLNPQELSIITGVVVVVTILAVGRWLIGYLNYGLNGELKAMDEEIKRQLSKRKENV